MATRCALRSGRVDFPLRLQGFGDDFPGANVRIGEKISRRGFFGGFSGDGGRGLDQAQQNRHDASQGDGGGVPGAVEHDQGVAARAAKGKKRFSGFPAGGGVSGGRRLVGGVATGVDFAEVLDDADVRPAF